MTEFKKVALVILDGLGVAGPGRGNAVEAASPQVLNKLVATYPAVTLRASGPLVGLPWGESGNSEVGHLNIGAGRIVAQDLPRINSSIADGSFYTNPALGKVLEHLKTTSGTIHLVGMLSPGGVHSSEGHLLALVSWCAQVGLQKVEMHIFADGRDTPQKALRPSLDKLLSHMQKEGIGHIATLTGRFYAMDRGGHWEQTLATFRAMAQGEGESASSVMSAVERYYSSGVFDEMIPPTVMADADDSQGRVKEGDAMVCFNFRQDRMIQLVNVFTQPEKTPLAQQVQKLEKLLVVTITDYGKDVPAEVMFPQEELKNHLSEAVSRAGLKQYHIAESEKYAHVTMFFNGGNYAPMPGEERLIVQSPTNNKRNYIDHPEMSAQKLTDELCQKITNSDISLFVANYANPDMVGHTGSLGSAIVAVKVVDQCLGQIVAACRSARCALLITADHGNVEQMINPKSGQIDKDHTSNPVPCILVADDFARSVVIRKGLADLAADVPEGSVSDVAPTVLELLGLPRPPEMNSVSLLPVLAAQVQVPVV